MTDAADREVAVFAAALLLPPGKRAAYLDEACAGDIGLRRRVEAFLAANAEAGTFLESPVSAARALALAATPRGAEGSLDLRLVPTANVGDRIGRYKLLQQIGEGGCGVVYMAEQEQPVQRRVALKVIKLGMDTKSVIARFAAERQALALMDHQNIAKVLDAGATDTGRPYFVMELVRGIKITDYCDQQNLSTQARLDLFMQVCRAVQHAHQKGIIHRDIKPSNILVTNNDGVAMPKVIDFGIAKATQGKLTDQTVFTAFEQFIGTPAYMSPEQAEMSALDIDTRSDIYSLGVLLYELLTGKTPFDAKELLKVGLDEMRRTIREQEPSKPSTRLSTMMAADLTTIASHRQAQPPKLIHLVRGDLDWIVMKALEKDRTRRYDTANGLALDIQRHLKNEPVLASPPSNWYRLQKAVKRNKVVFFAAMLIAVMLAAATGISAWQAVRATRVEKLATQRLADSESISKFLQQVFESPNPARDARTITVAETLGAAAKKLEADLVTQPERRAKLQATLGRTYHALGLYREAVMLTEKVRDYYLATSGLEHPDTLMAMHNLSLFYDEAGRRDDSLKLREQVLALRRKASGPENTNTISAMDNLAFSYDEAGRRDEALKLREEVLALRRKVIGPEAPDTVAAMGNLAISCDRAGRRDQALKLREGALTLSRKVMGPNHPSTIRIMNDLSVSYGEAGRLEEFLKLAEQVVAISRKVNGPEHPVTLAAMENLGNCYELTGRLDDAQKLHEEILSASRKVNGPEHPSTIMSMLNLAISYDETGRVDDALKLREEALAVSRKVNGQESPDTLEAMQDLAKSYDETGRRTEAIKLREDTLTVSRKVSGPENPDTLSAMQDLADTYDLAGRADDALRLYQDVVFLYDQLTTTQPGNNAANIGLAKSHQRLGDLFEESGKTQEAVTNYQFGLQNAEAILADDAANSAAKTLRLTCRIRLGIDKAEVVVSKISPHSQALAIGLKEGDVLVRFDGKPVVSAADLPILTGRGTGKGIELEIRRVDKPLKLTVNAGALGVACEDRVLPRKNSQ